MSIEEIDKNRFIDINIDSDDETKVEIKDKNNNINKTHKNRSSNNLFNFKNKLTNNNKPERILANLSEIKIVSDEDDDTIDEDEEENDKYMIEKRLIDLNISVTSFCDIRSKSLMNSSTLSTELYMDETSSNLKLGWETLDSLDLDEKALSTIDQDELLQEIDRTLNEISKQQINRCSSASLPKISKSRMQKAQRNKSGTNSALRNDSLVDGLLGDIYDRFNITLKENMDSDVFTEFSLSSSRYSGVELDTESNAGHESESRTNFRLNKATLHNLDSNELGVLINEMNGKVNQTSSKLIRLLKQKDKLSSKLNRNFDVITALLQANSLKRREDTQMKFTLNPVPGEAGFAQWKDAMQALVKLPGGIPKEFRKSIWLNLSKKYIKDLNIDWNKTRRATFNDRSNPDDDELGIQIVKDLHRTGCSAFSGHENEQDRALLKRVLLAYARYNKSVGYCQGFNIIAALILEIVERKEDDALMCMIFLIDHILPEGYFTNSMHSLAIDMTVFRELLKLKLPKLHQHLNDLQYNYNSSNTKFPKFKKKTQIQQSTYEPPLTNVFTMQWFLTLFATCLPKSALLRVWDCIFLFGSEILFRTSIAIWDKLSVSIMKATSADSFYSMMSILSIRLFDQNLIEENELINNIFSYGQFPMSFLSELREKFTFNINPFQIQKNEKTKESSDLIKISDHQNELKLRKKNGIDNDDEDDEEIDDLAKMISCFALLMPNRAMTSSDHQKEIMIQAVVAANALGINKKHQKFKNAENNLELNLVTPGAISFISQIYNPKPVNEQININLNELKNQYKKMKERQKQAQIIIQSASAQHKLKQSNTIDPNTLSLLQPTPIVNHLLIKPAHSNKNTVKTAIHFNTDNVINNNLIEKIKKSKNVVESLLHVDDNKPELKNPNIYFSDDNESNDEDADLTQTEDLIQNERKSLEKMSLLDLAERMKNQTSSSSSSSISSPASNINNRKLSRENSKNITTSIIIDHLVKEENRNITPLNPFPKRHVNSNIAKNGNRLGLYK